MAPGDQEGPGDVAGLTKSTYKAVFVDQFFV